MKKSVLYLLVGGLLLIIVPPSLLAANFSHELKLSGDSTSRDQLGDSTAISGNILVVGAPRDSSNGKDSGAVYIYSLTGGASAGWQLSQKLMLQNAQPDELFGAAVTTNGELIIVGAPGDDEHGQHSGAVYIFAPASGQSGQWVMTAKLVAKDAAEEDRFGASVAIDGPKLLIGAPIKNSSPVVHEPAAAKSSGFIQQGFTFLAEGVVDEGIGAGAAYIFSHTPGASPAWIQTAKLLAKEGGTGDVLGNAVAISGNVAVVGAVGNDIFDNIGAGSAHIFTLNPADGVWHEIELWASDQFVDDHYGSDVAIVGDTIAIGAYQRDENGFNTGKVYIYGQANGEWNETAQLFPDDIKNQGHFGTRLAMSDKQLVVTGYNPNRPATGFAYLYERAADGWHLANQKTPGSDTEAGFYGTSVAINKGTIAVGAFKDDGPGSLYVYSDNQVLPPAPALTGVLPKTGLWWNSHRPGHGMDIQRVGDNLFLLWYTYRGDGTPIWYLASAPFSSGASSWSANLDLYSWDGRVASSVKAGRVQLSLNTRTQATISWEVQGQSGSEVIEYYQASSETTPVNYTGTWFNPAQPGYGLTILTQGAVESTVLYFYDSNGKSTWALGVKPLEQQDAYGLSSYSGFCPHCVFQATRRVPVGAISLRFSSPSRAKLSTDLILKAPLSGDWQLDDIDIDNFTSD